MYIRSLGMIWVQDGYGNVSKGEGRFFFFKNGGLVGGKNTRILGIALESVLNMV